MCMIKTCAQKSCVITHWEKQQKFKKQFWQAFPILKCLNKQQTVLEILQAVVKVFKSERLSFSQKIVDLS
jgi:hypothetical protein